MNETRQRSLCALLAISLLTGCQARSSVEAAQTAVAVAHSIPTGLPPVLATANVQIKTSPEGVPNDAVTDVSIEGTDTSGTLANLDPRARQAAATAALELVAQYYPNATITLNVVDVSGNSLVSGRRPQ